MTLEQILNRAPVIPVVIIDDAKHAIPLARALAAGGLPVIEITLRTPAGLKAIRAIAREVPEAVVGAGTALTPKDFENAVAAGAKFVVSPGATPELLNAVAGAPVTLLPGIATASEAMALIARGYRFAKHFPAQAAGGTAFLSAISSPLPQLRFCPTGGITLASAPEYLALPNVVCIGGSWMAPRTAITAENWAEITAAAKAAAALKK